MRSFKSARFELAFGTTAVCARIAALAAAVFLTVLDSTRGAVVAEWSFRTNGQNLDIAANGGSAFATNLGSTIVSGAAVPAPAAPELLTGYLSVARTNERSAELFTTGSGGSNHWNQYMGYTSTRGWGTGTVLMVVRPHKDYATEDDGSGVGVVQRVFFSMSRDETGSGSDNDRGDFRLGLDNNLANQLNMRWVGADGSVNSTDITTVSWDTNDWYLISASWRELDGMRLFIANLTDLPNSILSDSTGMTSLNSEYQGTALANEPLYIGGAGRDGAFTNLQRVADADFALVRIYNEQLFSNEAQFYSFADGLVPEPSTALLLVAGGLLLARRVRRRS